MTATIEAWNLLLAGMVGVNPFVEGAQWIVDSLELYLPPKWFVREKFGYLVINDGSDLLVFC